MFTGGVPGVGGCHGSRPDDPVLDLHPAGGRPAQDGKVQPEEVRRHRKLVLTISRILMIV